MVSSVILPFYHSDLDNWGCGSSTPPQTCDCFWTLGWYCLTDLCLQAVCGVASTMVRLGIQVFKLSDGNDLSHFTLLKWILYINNQKTSKFINTFRLITLNARTTSGTRVDPAWGTPRAQWGREVEQGNLRGVVECTGSCSNSALRNKKDQ